MPTIASMITTSASLLAILIGGQIINSDENRPGYWGATLVLSGLIGSTLGFFSFHQQDLAIPALILVLGNFGMIIGVRRLQEVGAGLRLDGIAILTLGLLGIIVSLYHILVEIF
jgi:hypothetical protein